jgi:hypothetical protein
MLNFSAGDDQTFMSLKSLVNRNNGFFKSAKQAQFLFKSYSSACLQTSDQAITFYGIPLEKGQTLVSLTATTRWADYGTRSLVPVIYAFVLDKVGVVGHYKVNGNGNLRDGWSPDPMKCKLVWSRPSDAVCPWTFEEVKLPAAEVAKSNLWLGGVGEKIEVELKFIRGRDMGYSQFGPMFLSVFEDNLGNVVNVWKDLSLEPNETIKVKGTIKSCDLYKERKQTTLIRVKVI